MAEQSSQDEIHRICSSGGGILIAFETIGTLHQCVLQQGEEQESEEGPNLQWEVVGYGVPAVIANNNGVVLCLADAESGEKLCSFAVSQQSQYTVFEECFHIFTRPSGCFGIQFADEAVSEKLFNILRRLVTSLGQTTVKETDEGTDSHPVCSESSEEDDEEIEGVDGIFQKTKKKKRKLEISDPSDFQHLSHVGGEASIMQLTEVFSWKETLRRKERVTSQVISIPTFIIGGSQSSPELNVYDEIKETAPPAPLPPPPPPPPAIVPPPPKLEFKKKDATAPSAKSVDANQALVDEIKKGVILRPVSGDRTSRNSERSFNSLQEELKEGMVLRSLRSNRTMTLPRAPTRHSSEQLLFEIKTFRRKRLHTFTRNLTDSKPPPDENSLENILKKSLSAMFHKIPDSMDISNVGSVNRCGKDTFDGLF